ncbi:MAG: carboxymuconolactone decarboxylase family protein [Phenylobacterium sp.]
MRLTEPRIAPLSDDDMDAAFKVAIAPLNRGGRLLNIYRALARSPEAGAAFLPWAKYILSRANDLAPREREIVILRIGVLCGSGYEWTQHHRIGLREGLTEPEIEALKAGVEARRWSAADAALIRAADELHRDQFVSETTWSVLRAHFTEKQCMAVVFTAGQYVLVSMLLNTFGVQLDEGQVLDPDLDRT